MKTHIRRMQTLDHMGPLFKLNAVTPLRLCLELNRFEGTSEMIVSLVDSWPPCKIIQPCVFHIALAIFEFKHDLFVSSLLDPE